jgi:hypothetical protein
MTAQDLGHLDEFYGCEPGTANRLLADLQAADPEADVETLAEEVAEVIDDAAADLAQRESYAEPEAEVGL